MKDKVLGSWNKTRDHFSHLDFTLMLFPILALGKLIVNSSKRVYLAQVLFLILSFVVTKSSNSSKNINSTSYSTALENM